MPLAGRSYADDGYVLEVVLVCHDVFAVEVSKRFYSIAL